MKVGEAAQVRSNMIDFRVADWSAWAPGLTTRDAWLAWAQAPTLPTGDGVPELPEVPAMQRRRIERLGRMAVQVACWCEPDSPDNEAPLVFASRHGDVARSLGLLEALVHGEPMSPTAFGLSVHNAIAALYSMARGHRGNYLALAAGSATVEAACMEAAGLLADGAPEVRIVVYDAPIPEIFSEFADEPTAFFAWCWRIVPLAGAGTRVSLRWGDQAPAAEPAPALLPRGLDMLRFLLAGDQPRTFVDTGASWHWQCHG